MLVIKSREVEAYPLEGIEGVRVKYLLHAGLGAKRIQLRIFILDVGASTPLERHAHEHEVFILKGNLLIHSGSEEVEVEAGDAIFIPSYETHQLKNIGDTPAEFLCTKETSEIPEILRKNQT